MDMLLLNHASVTTLPGSVPASTTFMKIKTKDQLISGWKTEKESQK